MSPAGTVHMSILDWAKFILLHLNAAKGQASVLKLNTFKKLQLPIDYPPPSYAMGWIVEDQSWAKGKILIHAGSNQYWYAKVWVAPGRDLAILVALNRGGDDSSKAANEAALYLVEKHLKQTNISVIDNSSKK